LRRAVKKTIDEFQRMLDALGQHNAELGQLSADHVHQLGALADQQIPRPVQRQDRLLSRRLDRDKPHRRPRHRFRDRLRVTRIGFAPLDVGFGGISLTR